MTRNHRTVPVSQVMTSRVRTADAGQRLQDVLQILLDERCHHVPIVQDGRPVGMISHRDLVRIARAQGHQTLAEGFEGDGKAADIMSRELCTIGVDDPVELAIDRIGVGDIHALVVVDEQGDLAGIVTHYDLLHYLAG